MPKLVLKNLPNNNLISFMKENKIGFQTKSRSKDGRFLNEKLLFTIDDRNMLNELSGLLNTQFLYHNTSINCNLKVKNYFNYNSNQYENITFPNTELELPLFYIENTNDKNNKFRTYKALNSNRISKDYILQISNLQQRIPVKNTFERQKMSNILFCNNYNTKRNKEEKQHIPYYNDISIDSEKTKMMFGNFIKEINFQEEFVACLETFDESESVDLSVDRGTVTVEGSFDVLDLYSMIASGDSILNENDKIVLSKEKNNSNVMNNSFKKFLIKNFLDNKTHLLKNLKNILENEFCEKEFIIYKIDKFLDTDSLPFQSLWMFEDDVKEYIDLQIKRDKAYRYQLKPYVIIYGTSVTINNKITTQNTIEATVTYAPSFKISQLDMGTKFAKVISHIQLPPYVKFINESNSENHVKIYLDLKKGSYKDTLEYITLSDSERMNFVEFDEEGKAKFEYFTQQGVFEVFRMDSKPKNIYEFENKKIIKASNSYYSTSVVFKDNILPNKKYYYMFRALNVMNIPSNPTKIYEVELIKDSNNSKINVTTIKTENNITSFDKKMKRLIQIKPAFEHRVFDDTQQVVEDMDSFKKNIDKLSLGIASDKIWGKKFKIRIKSKDTGKIIDLNIKFDVIKDNII